MQLEKIDISAQTMNPFDLLANQWMLISAGSEQKWNTMTASWGGVGVIWGAPAATAYIRHSRYTKEFVDQNEFYTITFLKEGCKKQLGVLGSKSGRDMNKMQDSGLTPVFVDGQPTFAEASLVLVCKKRCKSEIAPGDILQDETRAKWYADEDYHTMYIGEIVAAYRG